MAIVWGPWWYSWPSNGLRMGFDVSVSDVNHNSTSVTYTIAVYTQNQYSYGGDAQSFYYKQDLAGRPDVHFTNNEGSSPVLRATTTKTWTYSNYGVSPGGYWFVAELNGGAGGIAPYATINVDIPPRPIQGPDAPTGAALARNTDAQATLTWTPHPTVPSPYTSQTIRMRRWDGATPWTNASWTTIASVSKTATSYSATGLSANHAYQLSVRSENQWGSSDWNDSNVIFMTPSAPSGVTSIRTGAGLNITTTWTDTSYVYPSTGTWTIQRSVNGGAFADVGTVSSKTPTSFVDTSPGAGTNQYRVAAVVGALQSGYTTGNTVAAPTPPLAPTVLAPNGTSVDLVNDANVFSWTYNAGGTGALQTHFTIETSINSGSTWVALTGATDVASASPQFTVPAGTLSNGVPYLWRVRTEGIVSAGYGPNSASATLTGSTKPTLTLSLPAAATHTIPLIATWTYAQAELLPQSAFQALLYAADGTTLLEEINSATAAVTVNFTYSLVTGNTYIVKVRVQSSAGVWSNYATMSTDFTLLPPANVSSSGVYQACTGTVLLHFDPGTVTPGVNFAIESITLERRAEGEDWVVLAQGLLIPTDFLDGLPKTNGLNEYRITALSAAPSTAVMPILAVPGTDGQHVGDPLWAWLSYGDNFENDLRVHGDLSITESVGRAKTQQYFLGREKPVALVGQNTSQSVQVGGVLFYDALCRTNYDSCTYDSAPAQWRAAGLNSEVVCYRDYTGRRLFGVLSDVPIVESFWPGKASVSYVVTVVDFMERYVQLVVM